MPTLPDAVFAAAETLGVIVYRAHKSETNAWNEQRGDNELRHFCGHYWYLSKRGQGNRIPVTAQQGPFMSESAAYRDAITTLEKMAQDDAKIAKVLRDNAVISQQLYRKLTAKVPEYA